MQKQIAPAALCFFKWSHKLWEPCTFVDFDEGVNSAVKRLRACLGDSADKPPYIETVSRSGYRFVAPVITFIPTDRRSADSELPRNPGAPGSGIRIKETP